MATHKLTRHYLQVKWASCEQNKYILYGYEIEWTVKAIAEAIPKKPILFMFLWSLEKKWIISLLNNQYFINKKDVRNILGLNTKELG